MIRMLCVAALSALLLIGCSNPNAAGPTYPVVGTVDQKQMEKNADAVRLTYYGLISIAAEYTDLPRCTATQGQPCSSQAVVNEIRQYRQAAGTATKGAVEIATNPTKTSIPVANAVADAQRAVEVFRNSLAKVRPDAMQVK